MSDGREHTRADYRHFLAIPTRWMDNDTYGHVNNVTYYSYFDTVVNEHLVHQGGLDIRGGEVVGFVVETSCRYFRPITFPETIDAGMRVTRLGRSVVLAPTVADLPLRLAGGAQSASSAVSFTPASCDAHVLAAPACLGPEHAPGAPLTGEAVADRDPDGVALDLDRELPARAGRAPRRHIGTVLDAALAGAFRL